MTTTDQVDLFLFFPELSYLHVLSIPLKECIRFSLSPLKWLQYLGFVIYGSIGVLYTRDSGGRYQEVDYNRQIEAHQYYFRSKEPPRFIDVNGLKDRVTTSMAATPRRRRLKEELEQRDMVCIFSGIDAEDCEGFHILPHSKGDEYIHHVSELRAGTDNAVRSIDDIRNAFLAYSGLHKWWGKGGLAILKTPNFALKSSDIGYNSGDPPSAEKARFILQQITTRHPSVAHLAPHNSDIRLPLQMDQWLASFLTDTWYGCCAYNAWKVFDTVDILQDISRKEYCGKPDNEADYDPHKERRDSLDSENNKEDMDENVTPKPRESCQLRRKRAEETDRNDATPELSEGMMQAMDIILNLRMRMTAEEIEVRRKREKEAEKKREEERSVRVRDWLESVHST